ADRAAPAVAGCRDRANVRVGQRLFGGRERETVRAIGELEQLAIADNLRGIEILDLGGDADWKTGCIEQADRGAAAFAGEQRGPGRGDIVAYRRNEPETRDRDAASGCHSMPPRR